MITNPKVDEIIFRALKAKPMVVVCSWCEGSAAKTAAAIASGFDVTHGICPACVSVFEKGAR